MSTSISSRRFWTSLLLIAAGSIAVLFVLDAIEPRMNAVSTFTMLTISVFTVIVGLAFVLGLRSSRSESKYGFVRLVMILIFVKMMICVLLIVYHLETERPESKLFIIPFLLIYLIFTIFEVSVLEKLARVKPMRD